MIQYMIQLTGDAILFLLNCFEIIISIYKKPSMIINNTNNRVQ